MFHVEPHPGSAAEAGAHVLGRGPFGRKQFKGCERRHRGSRYVRECVAAGVLEGAGLETIFAGRRLLRFGGSVRGLGSSPESHEGLLCMVCTGPAPNFADGSLGLLGPLGGPRWDS